MRCKGPVSTWFNAALAWDNLHADCLTMRCCSCCSSCKLGGLQDDEAKVQRMLPEVELLQHGQALLPPHQPGSLHSCGRAQAACSCEVTEVSLIRVLSGVLPTVATCSSAAGHLQAQ